jgi:hypothetical protein
MNGCPQWRPLSEERAAARSHNGGGRRRENRNSPVLLPPILSTSFKSAAGEWRERRIEGSSCARARTQEAAEETAKKEEIGDGSGRE